MTNRLLKQTPACLAAALALSLPAMASVDYTGTDFAPWSYSSGCVVWRATSGQLFHASTVADVDASGNAGAEYTFGTEGHPWQIFASNQSAYTSPGATLVFDEAGYNNNSDAQFAPMSFGGMWVRVLQAENTPYCITDNKTDGSNRQVELGATGASTYFKFDESFTFNRNSATAVKGEATVEIASGKTFTINARAGKGAVVDAGNTLVLKGAGTLAVVDGLTVNGTLDLSATTRPTIDGDVALNGTILLPAGTALPYTVCSGTLSGLNVTVKIGDDEAVEKRMTISGGAITALDDPVYEFSENFPAVVPSGTTYTFIGGETLETAATVSVVSVSGTLKTTGYIILNGLSILTGGTLDVQDSTATATATTYGSYGDKQILGNIIVRAGSTFAPTQTDFLDWSGTTDQTIDIYGTLAMGNTRWSIKHDTNCKINLYPGARVTGTGDSNGVFDLIHSDSKLNVYRGDNGGEVVIEGKVKTRNANTPIWVAADTTLKIGGLNAGGVNKSGDGTLEISGTISNPLDSTVSEGTVAFVDTTVAVPLTVNEGNTVSASASTGVTVPLDATLATNANISVSGAGTINGTVAFGGKPGTVTGLDTSTWKGTVELAAIVAGGTSTQVPLQSYGNTGSSLVLAGISGNTWLANGNATINAAVTINDTVGFRNGKSGATYTFTKIAGGSGNLSFATWGSCSGVTYGFTTLDADSYSGTIALNGNVMTFNVGNILKTDAVPGGKILSLSMANNPTVNIADATLNGVATNLVVKSDGVYIVKMVNITVPTVANATAEVTVGGETVEPTTVGGNIYSVAEDSTVTVTYSANEGCELSGTATYTIDSAKEGSTFTITDTQAAVLVAYIDFSGVTNYYTSVSNAIVAASEGQKVVCLIAAPDVADTYGISVGETVRIAKGEIEYDGIVFPQGDEYNNSTTETGGITLYSCALYVAIVSYGETSYGASLPLDQLLVPLWQSYTPEMAGLVVRVVDESDATFVDATGLVEALYTYDSSAHTYSLKTMVAAVTFQQGELQQTQYVADMSWVLQAAIQYDITATLLADLDMSSWGSGMTIPGSVDAGGGQMVDLNAITIDLGGKTITGPADGYALVNAGADVTITGDGKVEGAGIVSNATSAATTTISGGTFEASGDLFAAEEGSSIAVSGGTFNKTVEDEYIADGYEVKDNGDGTYGVRVDKGWIYEDADYQGYTGTWDPAVFYDEGIAQLASATYTANTLSAGRMVTIGMELGFDAVNEEDDDYADAKAAVRLGVGEQAGTFVFQVYTRDDNGPKWVDVTAAGVDATTNKVFAFEFVLDMTNKTYTVKLDGVSMAADGNKRTFAFAGADATDAVQSIEFAGSGALQSITGNYNDEAPTGFVEDQVIGSVTLTGAQADWLNAQNNYDALAAQLANMTQAALDTAYLLNLNVLDENRTYTFTVTNIEFSTDGANETVVVTVGLTRTGALDGGINGELKLKGGTELGTEFSVLDSVTIVDADFSDGDSTTCTFQKGDAHAKFYQAVIE